MSIATGKLPFDVAPGVDLANVHPAVVERFALAADVYRQVTGDRITVTSGYRSRAKQEALYAARASNPYPVAKPGDSAHEYGLAIDSVLGGDWGEEWPVPIRQVISWLGLKEVHGADELAERLWTALRTAVGLRCQANDFVHCDVANWRKIVGKSA